MNTQLTQFDKTNMVKKILGEHMLADGFDFIMDFEKSHGSYIYDKFTESEFLDMFSMFASTAIGYNHPYVVKHSDWLGKLCVNKPTLADVYSEEFADFMKVFSRVAMPKELQYCFFISGGALAVENAMKAAFDWKTRKNFENNIQKEAGMCIHFKQAFHGRSGYTLSLTNTADPRKYEYFPKFNWPRILNPKLHFPLTEQNLNKTIENEKLALLHIEEAILMNPNEIACLIIEPIQAEGGDNHFRDEFFVELRKICDENEILLIFDEVQTGLGLTGKMWAYEHLEIAPDIISFGKKTQVCGILANKEKLNEIPNNVFRESSRINSTFGGNWADVLRLKLILEVIENENLVENAKNMGDFLLNGLVEIQNKYPNLISNARGKGLMCAFDLPNGALRAQLQAKLYQHKLLVLTCGTQSIRFRPHLNVSQQDLQKTLDIITQVLSEM